MSKPALRLFQQSALDAPPAPPQETYHLQDGSKFRMGDTIWEPGFLTQPPKALHTQFQRHRIRDGVLEELELDGEYRIIGAIDTLFSNREAARQAYIELVTSQIKQLQRCLFRARTDR